ncbi:MAG: hypothetical protein K2J77_09450 [Oscillospiraceae bacterium]|nr:hypothetical protein [Oscillospiraceae bacterium]
MSRLNPVFTAITDIDDSIVLNAKKSRKRPLAIVLAAAAILTLVGFTIANRYGVSVNDKDAFDYRLTVQSLTIPTHEEMEALGAVNEHKSEYSYEWNTLPSTVFKTFGISPIMNDNFSESECDSIIWANYSSDGTLANATFNYELTDKALDKTVKFRIFCMTKEGAGLSTNLIASDTDKERMEMITLNDGSAGVVFESFLGGLNIPVSHAEFSYNGIAYSLYLRDGTNEDMKQVLSDFGVL